MNKGKIFIFSGPSGCGKSTVLSKLIEKHEHSYFSISATTREPRPGETDGVNYLFVTRERFDEMLAEDEFIEHAEYVGNCYGTPKTPMKNHLEEGDDVFLDIEVQGAVQVMAKLPEAVSIFIAPPSIEELEARLRKRSSETEEKIKNRIARGKEELLLTSDYDYVVINDSVDRAVDEILGIIEKSKSERN